MANTNTVRLNSFQLDASQSYFNENLMILAPPGSGKTLTLIHRIYNLITTNKVKPRDIIALTYTKKAAEELEFRLNEFEDLNIYGISISTFHKLGNSIVKQYYNSAGFNDKPQVINGKKEWSFICSSLLEFFSQNQIQITDKDYDAFKNFKNMHMSMSEYQIQENYSKYLYNLSTVISRCKSNAKFMNRESVRVRDFISFYNQKLKKKNYIDFCDQITLATKILNENHQAREYYRCKKYILVDEFQDTTKYQMDLLNAFITNTSRITVFGDDDQTIFSYAGVSSDIFSNFEREFNPRIVKLEENYRTTGNILKACNSLIENNEERFTKNVFTQNPMGNEIFYNECHTIEDECVFVAEKIKYFHREMNIPYKNIAILYRTNQICNEIEPYLKNAGIPCNKKNAIYLTRGEKNIVSCIKFFLDNSDEASLRKILEMPLWKISKTKIGKLEKGCMYESLLEQSQNYNSFTNVIEFIDCFQKQMENYSPSSFIYRISEKLDIKIKQLKTFAQSIQSVGKDGFMSFIEQIVLNEVSFDSISLSTVHKAKGKEWEVVFVVRANDGVMPVWGLSFGNCEEERRIAYVAMSRSKKELIVSWIGTNECKSAIKSRFIDEMIEKNYKRSPASIEMRSLLNIVQNY